MPGEMYFVSKWWGVAPTPVPGVVRGVIAALKYAFDFLGGGTRTWPVKQLGWVSEGSSISVSLGRTSVPFFSLSMLVSFLFRLLFDPFVGTLYGFASHFLATANGTKPIIGVSCSRYTVD